MVKGEGLDVLYERMNFLDPNVIKTCRFLGCDQIEAIEAHSVSNRVSWEMENAWKHWLKNSCIEESGEVNQHKSDASCELCHECL